MRAAYAYGHDKVAIGKCGEVPNGMHYCNWYQKLKTLGIEKCVKDLGMEKCGKMRDRKMREEHSKSAQEKCSSMADKLHHRCPNTFGMG